MIKNDPTRGQMSRMFFYYVNGQHDFWYNLCRFSIHLCMAWMLVLGCPKMIQHMAKLSEPPCCHENGQHDVWYNLFRFNFLFVLMYVWKFVLECTKNDPTRGQNFRRAQHLSHENGNMISGMPCLALVFTYVWFAS